MTDFAQRTIDLARRNVTEGGRPFATVIVKDGGPSRDFSW
jgi:tRNA(Arg) A34 adenosine deaminase TadA